MGAWSWQTSLFGLMAAIGTAIVESPELVDGDRSIILFAKIMMALGVGGIGVRARDHGVSDEQAKAGVITKPEPQEVIVVDPVDKPKESQ